MTQEQQVQLDNENQIWENEWLSNSHIMENIKWTGHQEAKNVNSGFPKTPSYITLWRKKNQPRGNWKREEFVWYASYFSAVILLLSIWKLYSLCPVNISRDLSTTYPMCLGRRHTQWSQARWKGTVQSSLKNTICRKAEYLPSSSRRCSVNGSF